MKDSGISWAGIIPADWQVLRGKIILTLLERPVLADDGVITCFRDGEVTLRSNRREDGFTISMQETGYQGIESGDLVVHGMDGFAGAIGISDSRGKATPVLNVLDSSESKMYLMYQMRTMAYCGLFFALSSGIRVRSCDTNWNKLKGITYLVPPKDEQVSIANYINDKCEEIDLAIKNTRHSIKEYNKLKQSIITEAVIKGVRGERPMKDSCIEWIGEIPENWEVKKVKFLATQFLKGEGITKEEVFEDGDTECVRYGEIYTKYSISFDKCVSATRLSSQPSPQCFGHGDLLAVCTGELIEEIGKVVAYLGSSSCLAGGDIIIIKHTQDPTFLSYALNSNYAQAQRSSGKIKLKVVHISAYEIKNTYIAVPPIAEQEEITAYLNEKCSTINSVIASKETLISELEAYKKSLIYEYVTGKKVVI